MNDQPSSSARRSSGGAFSLERRFVTCRETYDRESERIFSSKWLCVARVEQLDPAGRVLPLVYEDHKFFLASDEDGQVRAFRNFCRHRGSLLVTADNCSSFGSRIQCPYHAWTYDRQGRLVSAPNMEGVSTFCSEDNGLIEIACAVYQGFVWISFQPETSLEEFLAPVAWQFEDWGTGDLEIAATLEYDVQANWKLIFQNYSECYHCPIVHPALNRLSPYKDSSNDIDSGPILGGPMQLAEGVETMSSDGAFVGEPLPGLSEQQLKIVNYFTIFPSMFLSTHPDYVMVHLLQRSGVRSTKVVCHLLFHSAVKESATFDPASAVEFWDLTNRQDWEVCELAQAGMEDSAYIPGPYSNLESVLAEFDRHYKDVMQLSDAVE